MKKLFKIVMVCLVAGLGFYNMQISSASATDTGLKVAASSASADPEEEEGDKYKVRIESSGSATSTVHREGKPDCTISFDYVSVQCAGKGTVDCESSYETSNEESTCE